LKFGLAVSLIGYLKALWETLSKFSLLFYFIGMYQYHSKSDKEEEPLNADNDSETIANIRSTIKERVTSRNAVNVARMARGNAIPAD
jgi:hypothetical protein